MWKEIKKIISSNNSNQIFPIVITVNIETIANPNGIANAFNNYFAKVAIDIQSSTRFSKKKYYDYLPPLNMESFFIIPTDSTEDISGRLAFPFNQSFSSGIFTSILKTSKVIYKKGSIDRFFCYLILIKFWKDVCITDFATF